MLDHRLIEGLMQAIAPVIRSATAESSEKATAPLIARIELLEALKSEKGDRGERGEAGPKGDVGEAGAQGEKGDPGPVGPIGPVGPQGDRGEKGERGDPGRDASDLSTIMAIAGERAAAAVEKAFAAMEVSTSDGGRTFVFGVTVGELAIVREVKTAIPLDRGVWKGGDFEPGDGVTLGGHFWIAQVKTTAKPGESPDWRQAVQRGRNGRDYRPDDERRPVAEPVRFG